MDLRLPIALLVGCQTPDPADFGLEPARPLATLACDALPSGQGDGTWYDADGHGACLLDPPPDDEPLLVAAMNADDWHGSLPCGACANVEGPEGSVQVRIVDLCPECVAGDLDLSPDAFERIAPLVDGRVPITWELVPCDADGPISWRFKDGSNPWWVAVQVRDHRQPVARVQVDLDGRWMDLERTDWNHFEAPDGLGDGPFRLRALDVHGAALVDDAVPLLDDDVAEGPGQFPACRSDQTDAVPGAPASSDAAASRAR